MPRMTPACVAANVSVGDIDWSLAAAGSSALARPKSRIFT
jgi:hypothetical protein